MMRRHQHITKLQGELIQEANVKRTWKNVVDFNFHDETDDSQLLTAELNST